MAVGNVWRSGVETYDHSGLPLTARPQRLLAGAALICIAFACSWTMCVNLMGDPADQANASAVRSEKLITFVDRFAISNRGDKLAMAAPTSPDAIAAPTKPSAARLAKAKAALVNFAMLFDPHFANGAAPGTFADRAPLQPSGWQVASAPQAAPQKQQLAILSPATDEKPSVPLPQPRPAQSRTAAISQGISNGAHQIVARAAADTRTIFEKLFGRSTTPFTLAYADADTSATGSTSSSVALYDHSTAVYDITARKVYLPDGTTLEAHSGLGDMLDDPNHADVHNRGVTPPTLYDLQPREALFHGVKALRLIPVDGENATYGRSGLLAHTFMLGPNGDSNGCVSFKDYEAFLDAYESHKISRLAVVTRLQ
jgi:Protein of unknown function (DUF2778)